MTTKLELPKVFFRDHEDRELPTPTVVAETARHFIVCADDPNIPELLDDARHYADPRATDCEFWLRNSAHALVKAIERQTA
jgi:hypothetical protein